MKLLRQTIRRMILQEGMMMPDQLPEDVVVVVDYTNLPELLIYYAQRDENGEINDGYGTFRPKGFVEMITSTQSKGVSGLGPCDGAATVRQTGATEGWGPLLYDVAIEVASSEASGLFADRRVVSSDAWNVWNTYMTKRDDVDHFQLDDQYDTLTPDWEDNCDQDVAMNDQHAKNWIDSPLSKVYVKNDTPMMDKLKGLDKLIEFYEEI